MLARWMPLVAIAMGVSACDPMPTGPSFEATDPVVDGGHGDPPPPPPPIPPGVYAFAISSSATDPSANQGTPQPTHYELYLWLISGTYSLAALEASFDVRGSDSTQAFFGAIAPHLGLSGEDLPPVLMAVAGCPTSVTLLGSISVLDAPDSLRITLVSESENAGGVNCGDSQVLSPFTCEPFVARAEARRGRSEEASPRR